MPVGPVPSNKTTPVPRCSVELSLVEAAGASVSVCTASKFGGKIPSSGMHPFCSFKGRNSSNQVAVSST
eukprot:scaffold753_cov390-Pavlova_lutheri.AAC.3